MVSPELAKVAKVVVDEFLDVRPGEELLIVIDSRTPFECGYVFRNAGVAAGAKTTLMEIPKPTYGFDYCFDYLPPKSVVAAIENCDVLINFSVGYSDFLIKALREGKIRGIGPGGGPMTDEVLVRTVGEVDSETMKDEMERMAALWNTSKTMRITSEHGTDVSIDIRGITSYGITGHVQRNPPFNMEFLPGGLLQFYDTAPMKEGTIVIDGGCLFGPVCGFPSEPIRMTVKDNVVIDVEGDKNLWPKIKAQFDELDDPNMYRLPAHFGIGTNPNCKNDLRHQEWERYRGSFIFATGDNSRHFFPKVLPPIKAKGHWDFQILEPTVYVDEKLVVEKGKILSP